MRLPARGKRLVRFAMVSLMPAVDDQPGVEDTGLDLFLDQLFDEAPPTMLAGVIAGSAVFVVSPVLTIGVPVWAPFLPKSLLDKHADRITEHPLYYVRQAAFLVKMMGGMCWAQDSTVRERFNLEPYPADPGTWRVS